MCTYCITTNYRKIYENHIGPIPYDGNGRTYEIHHIDGNHGNNDPTNLIAVTLQEHYDIHYNQKDWNACKLMKLQRMEHTPEEIAELGRKGSMGKVSAIDQLGKTIKVSTGDPRLTSGELTGVTKGKATVKDINGNIMSVDKNDPRILSGELVGVTKGLVVVKDKEGNIKQVSVNDHRIISGELVYLRHGMSPAWFGRKKQCEYCVESFDLGNYTKSHGEKCPAKIGLLTQSQKNRNIKKKEREVIIDDIIYNSLKEASKTLSIGTGTLHYRVNSKNFTNYCYLYDERPPSTRI
jgi:hypothetical protein